MDILHEYLLTFGWAITGSISMAVALPILIKAFDIFTPIDEWKEIQKGNISVAMVVSSVIIAFGIVIGFIVAA